jgi:hypothetical protein
MKNNIEELERSQPATGAKELSWFGLAAVGSIIAAGSIYLCYYCQIEEYGKASWLVITAGLGLIIAFCVLTVTLIAGIKAFIIIRTRRFWPVLTMVVSGLALIGLIGMIILGSIL